MRLLLVPIRFYVNSRYCTCTNSVIFNYSIFMIEKNSVQLLIIKAFQISLTKSAEYRIMLFIFVKNRDEATKGSEMTLCYMQSGLRPQRSQKRLEIIEILVQESVSEKNIMKVNTIVRNNTV